MKYDLNLMKVNDKICSPELAKLLKYKNTLSKREIGKINVIVNEWGAIKLELEQNIEITYEYSSKQKKTRNKMRKKSPHFNIVFLSFFSFGQKQSSQVRIVILKKVFKVIQCQRISGLL